MDARLLPEAQHFPLANRRFSRYTEQVFDPGVHPEYLRRRRVRRPSVPICPMFHTSRFAIPFALGAALVVSALAYARTDAHVQPPGVRPAAVAHVYRSTHVTDIPSTRSEWARYDTAAYVVSTLNLLTKQTAAAFSARLRDRYHVSEYVVRSDLSRTGLYFVQLIRSHGRIAGAFAYRMGWTKPQAVSSFGIRLGGTLASRSVRRSYRTDASRSLGTFKSTLPSYR